MSRILLIAAVAFAGGAEASSDCRRPRIVLEGGLLRQVVDADADDASLGLSPVVRGSVFVSRILYVGAEVGMTPPRAVRVNDVTVASGSRFADPITGGLAGAVLRLGPFQVRGELFAGTRALWLDSSNRVVLSGLELQPRAGAELWLGRHLTVGVLAGWSRDVVSTGVTVGLHLAPYDRG